MQTTFNYIGFWTLTRREVHRFLRLWKQTIIPSMITAVLYILIFGYSLGSRISLVQGVSYLEFIIPGLLMMAIVSNAYANTSSSLYLAKFQGNIHEMLTAPISYMEIVLAFAIGGVARGIIVGIGVLLVSILFAKIAVTSIAAIIFFTVMVSLLFSFAGIVTGLWANGFDQMMVFSTFLITPLTFLGGVFYSITMLPPFWQTVSHFNPILYMVNGLRYGIIGTTDVSLLSSVIVVTVLTLFFFFLAVYLFKKGYNLRT